MPDGQCAFSYLAFRASLPLNERPGPPLSNSGPELDQDAVVWQKFQIFRLARIKRRINTSWDTILDQTSSRTGIKLISEAKAQLLKLAQTAAAEFGVSSRFWAVRQAAIPGMGWTMLFLSITAVVWPIATSLGTALVVTSVCRATLPPLQSLR